MGKVPCFKIQQTAGLAPITGFCVRYGTQAQESPGKFFSQQTLADAFRPVEQQRVRTLLPVQEPLQKFFILLVSGNLLKHYTPVSQKKYSQDRT